MTTLFSPELQALIAANSADGHRPLLFANARIITQDPLIGDFGRADVLLGGSRIVGIGPGLLSAADDDGAIVIDCDGYAIAPAVIDVARLQGVRTPAHRGPVSLSPGNPASLIVVAADATDTDETILRRVLRSPDGVPAMVADGEVVVWNAQPVPGTNLVPGESAKLPAVPEHVLGTWIDENDFVHQHLSADGRYDETRGGRAHAFQGSFWTDGTRIDYLDDLGFWAFGEFVDGALHHAGYTFHRS